MAVKRPRNRPANRPSASVHYYRKPEQKKTGSPFKQQTRKPAGEPGLFSKIIDWLIIGAVIFCLTYSLIVRGQPKVLSSSWPYRPASAYQLTASQELSALRDRTKLTFDEGAVVDQLKKSFPEIADVAVELPLFGQTPVIRLSISPPNCLLVSGNKTFVIDSQGVAVGYVSEFRKLPDLPTLSDQSGYPIKRGDKVVSAKEVEFINQILIQSKKAGIPIESLMLPARAQELDIKTKDKSYIVKFHLGGNSLLQTGQFLAARHQFDQNHKDPTEYLDVRVEGKIYFK